MSKDKILVVDDNKVNRDVLARRLTHENYDVVTAAGGLNALERLRSERFSLVLLDMVMPDMDGIEVLQELRKSHGGLELPVLVVSADSDTPQMVSALDLGANDYLTKPIDFDLLLAKTRRHLALSATFASTWNTTPGGGNSTVRTGQLLGHYLLGDQIGQGAMGRVFRARDTRLQRDVAIKVMVDEALPDKALERFLLEARAVARVSHPGVVTIYEVAHDPIPYIAMELINGHILNSLPAHEMNTARAVRIIRQVLQALHVVHQAGVIHRDLKPANIMVCEGDRVIVMDFGLAKMTGQDLQLSISGTIYGTPVWMAPEQIMKDFGEVDHQTDLFAVAGLLYELITGNRPFMAVALPQLLAQILYSEAPSPRTYVPELSEALSRVILTGLNKRKEERWKDCQAFLQALEGLEA